MLRNDGYSFAPCIWRLVCFLGAGQSLKKRPFLGLLNYSALNRELIGHAFGSALILLGPLYHFLRRQWSGYWATSCTKTDASGLMLCSRCENVATIPVLAKSETKDTDDLFCYYCYHYLVHSEGANLSPYTFYRSNLLHGDHEA